MKITNFLGKAPKISSELLPDTAAQVARNCKLASGNLVPYPQPVPVGTTGRTGTIRKLHALRNPDNPSNLLWLSWTTHVDIAVASANLQDEQRFYYTGDGAPKVSNFALATTGAAPFPVAHYDLGLPVPPGTQTLGATATAFATRTTASFARGVGNIATIVTSAAHGLRTGNNVTVSGFAFRGGTYNQPNTTTITVTINAHGLANGAVITLDFISGTATDGTFTITNVTPNTFDVVAAAAATTSGDVRWDIRNFNATNVEITVVNPTTFTYFSPGPQVTPTANAEGRVDMGGLTQVRSYVFTWFTPWDEESIASRPSDNLFIKEGIQVTVSRIPASKPPGNNFVRGVRLYRTLAAASGTEYFRLATLWFPIALASVFRANNVSYVTTVFPHNLDLNDRFQIINSAQPSFNITGGIVTNVVGTHTFAYAQTGADVVPFILVNAGTLHHDVSENPPVTEARYWGAVNFDFLDDFDSRRLRNILGSDTYDAPPVRLQGLTSIQNNILVGFVGNTLYFSEPNHPSAWPARYATPVGDDIVALAAVAGALLVLTKSYPFIVSVTDPASGVSVSRIDVLYPCLSAGSVVTMDYGVVWSTNDGLAVYSPTSGAGLITKLLYNNDTWTADVNPSTVVASYYNESYFASHSAGGFVFEHDTKVGGFFVDTTPVFTAAWYDTQTSRLYYTSGTQGVIHEWDNLTQLALPMEWKSKVIVTKDMLNLGAARVIADYGTNIIEGTWDQITTTWENTHAVWFSPSEITFRFWANKQLVFTTVVNNNAGFRLPTGYRADTFEIGVAGDLRIRAIHLSETMSGLKDV